MEIKLVDMLPENLRQAARDEVIEEYLNNNKKTLEQQTKESKKLDDDVHEWAAKSNPKPAKS